MMSEGKLRTSRECAARGVRRVKSFEPMLSPILWTTIATAAPPNEHGIGHFVALDPATGQTLP